MTEFTGIAYEPHPVSPERKAELRAQGLRIIDIQFQPAESAEAEAAVEHEPIEFEPAEQNDAPKRGRKAKAD